MNGDFRDSNNKQAVFGTAVTLVASMILFAVICVKYNLIIFQIPAALISVLLTLAVGKVLSRGRFSADEKAVVFHVGFFEYKYLYSDISNIKTETGLTHSKGGTYAHTELIISLKNGRTVVFHDCNLPDDALSTPEKHKAFQENHKFTKLAGYVKSRLI